MEKASNVNFLWIGAQPALYTVADLGLLVVEVLIGISFICVAAVGVEHGADAFIIPELLLRLSQV